MRYQYVLFDLDGTLTDPKEGITKCVQYSLRSFGIEVECDRLIPFIGPPLKQMFETSYGVDGDLAVAKYRERFSTVGLFENKVYDGIDEMLCRLKKLGIKTAVATSKPQVYSLRILEKYRLRQYFDVVVGSELDGRRTDKAEVIELALKLLGNPDKSTAVMVGDREHDVIGAKKCGLKCIGVMYGYSSDGELEKAGADILADSVSQLSSLLTDN